MVCVKCNCPNNNKNSTYCRNCGTVLNSNFCTNLNCILNDTDDPVSHDPSDCYCDQCGCETEYFKSGYIKPLTYNHE